MCVRQMRPPGRGDFWILKIAHAPSPKNLPKNGFCPKKGVAFLTEDVFEKNFQVREKIPLSALAPAHMAAPLPGEAARGLTGSVLCTLPAPGCRRGGGWN
jgi:hypothetical protein